MSSNADDTVEGVQSKRGRRRGWAIGLGLAAVVLLTGGAYAAAYVSAGDTVPRNASVNGLPLGGLSAEEAVTALEDSFGEDAAADVELEAGGESVTVNPADAGLGVDYVATVESTGVGQSLDPAHIWRVLTGGGSSEIVQTVDDDALSSAVAEAADELDREAKDATIAYEVPDEGAPEIATTEGTSAVVIDRAAAIEAISSGYLTEGPIALPAAVTEPSITTATVDSLVTDWAEPAISAPVRVSTDNGDFDVTERAIARSTTFEERDGQLVGVINADELRTQTNPEIEEHVDLDEPKDASFRFEGGRPVVVDGESGQVIDAETLFEAVEPLVAENGDARAVSVEITDADPELDAAAAEELGVKEVIGEFTTEFPHADYRNQNIGRAAEVLTGHLIKPDETFSFNDTVGERTPENGFVDGNIIDGGRLRMATGGGVSQAVTTLYNAGFFAGLEDAEHWAHTLYFDRYPAGREATVAWGSKDLKIKNNTPHGVVIQGIINESSPGNSGSITFKMWSTEHFEVKTAEPQMSDYYQESPITDSSAECNPQSPSPGFTATYWRELYRDGELAKERENYSWTYYSARQISCG